MSQKSIKKLNKLAKALNLTRGERTKLKQDWRKTPNRSLEELTTRVSRVENTVSIVEGTNESGT